MFDPAVAVADRLERVVPNGGAVLVCSDLHLGPVATPVSERVAAELVTAIEALPGPGVVVLNGDCFELLASGSDVGAVLDAHPALTKAVAEFGHAVDRHVVVTVGNHDASLAWAGADVLAERLAASTCFVVDLVLVTDHGERVVRVEHGHRFDPSNAFLDPRSPLDTPLGHHVVREVLPVVTARPALADAAALAEPADVPRLVASRLVYRQLASRWWVLAIPVLLLALVRMPLVVRVLSHPSGSSDLAWWASVVAVGLVVDAVLLVAVAVLVAERVGSSLSSIAEDQVPGHRNNAARAAAEALCAEGFAGFLTGHTHRPELTPLGGGFYGNSGCGVLTLLGHPARLRLPPVFWSRHRRSWLVLEARHDVVARLVVGELPEGERHWSERLAVRRPLPAAPEEPTVVAELPGGVGYPLEEHTVAVKAPRNRVRRQAAVLVSASAVVSLLSALTPPLRGRLRLLLAALPVELPQVASAALVFGAVALLLLARGLRRGRRLAWVATLAILAVSVVLNLGKGGDIEEAVIAGGVGVWLAGKRSYFAVRSDAATLRRAARAAVVIPVVAVGAALVLVVAAGAHAGVDESVKALAERLAGNQALPIPALSAFVTPALLAAGIATVAAVLWRLFGPGPAPHRSSAADRARAREIVARHGGDTLAYFALRDDKDYFFAGDSVVAYAVRNGVCLVSPDPIGPPGELAAVWADFTEWADGFGWSVAVMGTHAGVLPLYEASGMRAIYLGDEAIVDCTRFSLDGGQMKSLRGAYHRAQRAGVVVEMHDPSALDPALEAELRELMTETRRGEAERGFSMTLSRIFDPADTGLLLAVAKDATGRAIAFCQYVPANDIGGYSLDLMRRRNDPDLPNGVTDVVVIETIKHLRETRRWGLCLNFAVLRAVVAGEADGRPFGELERKVLHRFSDSMQIESLWRYNEKFRPYWRPRYVAVDAVEHLLPQGFAIADAEQIWELPVIGRFLTPSGRDSRAG